MEGCPSSQGISMPIQGKHTLSLEDLALLFLPHQEEEMGREPGSRTLCCPWMMLASAPRLPSTC